MCAPSARKIQAPIFYNHKGLVTLVLGTHILCKKGIMATLGAWTSQLWSWALGLQVSEQPYITYTNSCISNNFGCSSTKSFNLTMPVMSGCSTSVYKLKLRNLLVSLCAVLVQTGQVRADLMCPCALITTSMVELILTKSKGATTQFLVWFFVRTALTPSIHVCQPLMLLFLLLRWWWCVSS